MIYYFIAGLILTVILLKVYIDKISKTKFFKKAENIDSIKKPCIQQLHKHKSSTPSMGGIAMNMTLLILTIIYFIITKKILWIGIILLSYGMMGFIDDYIKLKKTRDGVTPKEKLLGLTVISIAFAAYFYFSGQVVPQIKIPFISGEINVSVPIYLIILVFLITVASNSMNITDGLDGLALGIGSIVLGFIIYYAHNINDTEALFIAIVLESACLATLAFNRHPAKIFMGDTGSLMLGAGIAVLLIRLRIPLWIFLLLAVCLFETFSVILQLFSLKFFKRKIFKIAPFHHHLEKCGWKETAIVYSFWGVTVIFCLLSYLGLRNVI